VIYCLAAELLFVHKPEATDEQFEAFLERVMDELDNIGREDTNLGGSLAERTAEFVMDVEADSFEDAVVSMMSDLRTALHAADCSTAGWPVLFERKGGSVRVVEAPEAVDDSSEKAVAPA
jgi:hypothetical protein